MNHIRETQGGAKGYLLRRLIHIAQFTYPLIYYYFGQQIAQFLDLPLNVIVVSFVIVILISELIRLKFAVTVYGQRLHEAKQFSSFAWSALAVGLVLLFAPGKEYGIPIIWSCAFGDPFLGELRRFNFSKPLIFFMGTIFIFLLWLICYWYFSTPLWCLLLAPVIVAAEWPNSKWIDDNATMQLLPLFIILIIGGF